MKKSRAKELLALNMYSGYLIKDNEGKVPSYPKITKNEESEVQHIWSHMEGDKSFNDALRSIIKYGDDAELVEKAKSNKLGSSFFWGIYPDYEELKRIFKVFNENSIYKYNSIINFLTMG